MRAEVVEQHTREQNRHRRAPAAAAPEPTSQISPEFLDALPPEIRIEVIMQEALQNSRRSRANAPAEPQVPPADASAGFSANPMAFLRRMRQRTKGRMLSTPIQKVQPPSSGPLAKPYNYLTSRVSRHSFACSSFLKHLNRATCSGFSSISAKTLILEPICSVFLSRSSKTALETSRLSTVAFSRCHSAP